MSKTEVEDTTNKVTITLDGDTGDITIGGNGQIGAVIIKSDLGTEIVRLGHTGGFPPGVPVGGGAIYLKHGKGQETIRLSGTTGDILAGGNGQDGTLVLFNSNRTELMRLDGKTGQIFIKSDLGAEIVRLGHTGGFPPGVPVGGGAIYLKDDKGQETIRLSGTTGDILAGGNGQDGTLVLFNSNRTELMRLDGKNGQIRFGSGVGRDIALYPPEATVNDEQDFSKAIVHLDGNHGNIVLRKQKQGPGILFWAPEDSIVLNGQEGDISLSNADCAEEFDISEYGEIEPGTVMVLDQEGKLEQSREAYDKKVAGVISGAGDCKPGIVLDKKHSHNSRIPIALVGKVFCKVDAQYSPIEVGDLLTTSSTPGHAMKVDDPLKAFGAVIGKALRPLKAGIGLIPILIALQ